MNTIPPLPAGFNTAHEFPIVEKWDFYNHAGVAPLSRRAAEALNKYTQEALSNAYMTGRWYAQADKVRALCARIVNATPAEIAFVKNTSEGIAFVANGLTWKAGDEVLSTAVEYPANVYPWMDVAQRFGVRHVTVPEHHGRIDVNELLGAITPKTRLVALSHVEYASGFVNDLATIGKVCRERGVLFCVDAIQSIGARSVDVRAMNIDFLSADGHKWMLGPEGLGFFYCRKELLNSLHPEIGWWNVINAQDYGKYDFTLRPDAQRFECGTYNIPGILALGTSLELLLDVGIEAIQARLLALTDRLADGLQSKGYAVFSPRGRDEASSIVSFTHGKLDHAAIVRDLKKQNIEIALREGRLRASPHFYNSPEQIDRLVKTLP